MNRSLAGRVLPTYLVLVAGTTALFVATALLATARADRSTEIAGLVGSGIGFFVCTWALSIWLVRRINRPIRVMEQAAAHFAEGDLDYRLAIEKPNEVHELADALNGMAEQLRGRINTINRQRGELAGILSSMVEGVVVLDSARRVRSANAAAAELAQCSVDEAVGRSLLDVYRSTTLAELADEAAISADPVERTITIYLEEPRYIHVSGSTLHSETDPRPGLLLVLHDVTRLRRLEQIRRDFVANVSHELKTPVTTIKGFLETILYDDAPDPDEVERFLTIVLQNANRLHAIIEDLLSLSRLEQTDTEIPRAPTSVARIARRVEQNLAEAAAERSIELEVFADGECEALVSSSLIEQALSNLVSNAIKYCEPGTRVQIRLRVTDDTLFVAVGDNGPGIPPNALSRIFERFYRVDRARSRAMGGTGLGLAIVKHIALAHGGTVEVESSVGSGSTFTMIVPRAGDAAAAAAGDATSKGRRGSAERERQRRLL